MPVKDYKQDLLVRLAEPNYAALYLKTALNEMLMDGDKDAFLLALRDVVEAKELMDENHQSSDALSQALNQGALPSLETLIAVLHGVGIAIEFKAA
jgi:DNA-binding phage protein